MRSGPMSSVPMRAKAELHETLQDLEERTAARLPVEVGNRELRGARWAACTRWRGAYTGDSGVTTPASRPAAGGDHLERRTREEDLAIAAREQRLLRDRR